MIVADVPWLAGVVGLLLGLALSLVTFAWWEKRQAATRMQRERRLWASRDDSPEDGSSQD